jgi:hypothetical protein
MERASRDVPAIGLPGATRNHADRVIRGEGGLTQGVSRFRPPGAAMISDLDIWRAAGLLIRKHGADAELEAAKHADLMLDRGDRDGQLVWLRIRRTIVELQTAPVGKPHYQAR